MFCFVGVMNMLLLWSCKYLLYWRYRKMRYDSYRSCGGRADCFIRV